MRVNFLSSENLIEMLDFTEQDYTTKVEKLDGEGIATFEEFINDVLKITESNNGTIEDAIEIANDAFTQL